ncbi:alpha/beta hydrolase-fold protein [Arthrobacter agilis]|uniref:carboxylesterase family protein n=1 Tax=Arthrobacter agilis TaxID=37921 RepID=UPI002366D8CF|nr:alpha/beta hydrolase-fold protein [Arthrobacter agilis]WDF32019.1 alpha/beta hydrolase-fold protein [Arthrobacter agilis]
MNSTTSFFRRTVATGVIVSSLLLGSVACGTNDASSVPSAATSATSTTSEPASSATAQSTSGSSGESTASTAGAAGTATSTVTESPTLESLVAEVAGDFDQVEWTDPDTGETLTYNIYLPPDYDESQAYPMVVYIPDSSLVGDDPTAALSQYGALVWAGAAEQAKQENIVVVPSYPEIIIDDHDSFTTTAYVEMTARLIESLKSEYAVDQDRVYGTGQSMGCMTVVALAAEYPDLFAAELLVSGQWDITELTGLTGENFVYTAAAGDDKASVGQTDVEQMLTDAGVSYNTATFDATWTAEESDAAAAELLATGDSAYFATFAEGTVLAAGGSDGGMGGEHMASFQPAYEITALRDWLFQQSAA